MDNPVYRGLKYNAEDQKKEYVRWYREIHDDASRYLTYRGVRYRPYNNHIIGSK